MGRNARLALVVIALAGLGGGLGVWLWAHQPSRFAFGPPASWWASASLRMKAMTKALFILAFRNTFRCAWS